METIIPITEFALGIHNRDLGRLQQHSSTDFNRLVWAQVAKIPQIGFPVVKHMRTPVTSITLVGQAATVRLGDERWGALVSLVRERGYWVIDEVELIAGPESRQRTQMKHTIRVQLANGLLSSTERTGEPRQSAVRRNPQPVVPTAVPTAAQSEPGDDDMPPIPLPFR